MTSIYQTQLFTKVFTDTRWCHSCYLGLSMASLHMAYRLRSGQRHRPIRRTGGGCLSFSQSFYTNPHQSSLLPPTHTPSNPHFPPPSPCHPPVTKHFNTQVPLRLRVLVRPDFFRVFDPAYDTTAPPSIASANRRYVPYVCACFGAHVCAHVYMCAIALLRPPSLLLLLAAQAAAAGACPFHVSSCVSIGYPCSFHIT